MRERLVEKAKKMSMTISTRKLPGFTDQPQKTPATIFKGIMIFHLRKWAKHSRSWILELVMDLKQIHAHISTDQW